MDAQARAYYRKSEELESEVASLKDENERLKADKSELIEMLRTFKRCDYSGYNLIMITESKAFNALISKHSKE
jgi:predicted nuclease with TOPRIM domain